MEQVLSENSVSVVSINEHWLIKFEFKMYTPNGYQTGTLYCRKNNNELSYGGLFTKEGTPFEVFIVDDFVLILILKSEFKLVIVSVYTAKSDSINLVNRLESLLESLEIGIISCSFWWH